MATGNYFLIIYLLFFVTGTTGTIGQFMIVFYDVMFDTVYVKCELLLMLCINMEDD